MAPPLFRADHIGSLMRPQYLLDAQAAVGQILAMHKDTSNASQDLVKKAQDAEKEAMKEAVEQQLKRGITPITSGEFERPSFVSGFYENLDGIEIKFMYREDFRTAHPIMLPYIRRNVPGRHQPIATGKVRWKQSAYMNEWLYVKSLLPEDQWKNVKITIPSPSWSHTQLKDGRAFAQEAYTDEFEYLRDIGEAVRQEVLALYQAGV
jgi:methionine synthase II (cobalamin-independent)